MSTTTVHLNNDEDDNNHFESKSTLIKTDSPSSKRSLSPPPKDMLKEHIRVISGCATNILSSIGIIFLNKYIFSHCQIKTMTLTAIQMAFTSLGLVLCLQMNTFVRKTVPIIKVLPLSIAFCAFVVFTNLSLEYNTIGTYQLFKVLTTPVVALISWQYYKTKYSTMVILTLIPVVVGVCTHSVNDIQLTLFGTIIASLGVIAASLYQVWVGERLKELEMNSQQLLYYQAPLSAILLLPFIFCMETFPSYASDADQRTAIISVASSGIVAFAVNLSVYWVIKNTSALTYNMIGHLKTISILVGGFLLFQDNLNFKQFIGILLTIFGLFSYTFVRMGEQNQLPCTRWNTNPIANVV
jgi:solute carrier family 35 protein E3